MVVCLCGRVSPRLLPKVPPRDPGCRITGLTMSGWMDGFLSAFGFHTHAAYTGDLKNKSHGCPTFKLLQFKETNADKANVQHKLSQTKHLHISFVGRVFDFHSLNSARSPFVWISTGRTLPAMQSDQKPPPKAFTLDMKWPK